MRGRSLHHVLALLVLAGTLHAVPLAPRPRIVVLGPTALDAGHVPRGQPLAYVVRIRNEGRADLEITPPRAVGRSAEQTATKLVRIAAGEEHELRVQAETGHLAGRVEFTFASWTNDPAMPTVMIELRAVVDPFVEILPSWGVRLERFHDENKRVTLTIRSHEPGQLVVLDIRSGGDPLAHELRRIDDSEYELQAWAPSGTPVGNGGGRLSIVTNSLHEPEREVRITYTIRGRLLADQDALRFPATEMRPPGQDDVTRLLTITHVDGKPFSLTSANCVSDMPGEPDPRVDMKWECAGASCRVLVTQHGGAGSTGFQGKLALTSNLSGEPLVKVPLQIDAKCRPRTGKSGPAQPCPPPLR